MKFRAIAEKSRRRARSAQGLGKGAWDSVFVFGRESLRNSSIPAQFFHLVATDPPGIVLAGELR
jgi:hypothetical protein